jgi:hypothetical protein
MSGRTMRRYVLNSKTGLLDPIFATGETIPESGIYRVIHSEHRLPRQVTLHRGELFPRCAKCDHFINFELLHPAPAVIDLPHTSRVHLFDLPVIEEDPLSSAPVV